MFEYFSVLRVNYHTIISVLGFILFIIISNQLLSGIMLSFSLLPEPMLIPIVREEEDLENIYIDDFFWLHERGVDLVFILIYFHLIRKIYLQVTNNNQDISWKSGIIIFLIMHLVVFCGLVLCCTHLSDITLTIAANILHTFFFFKGKPYWWLFTDMTLNTDTLIRLTYFHYISAFFIVLLGIIHGIDMHYDWKSESNNDDIHNETIWWDEVLSSEFSESINFFLIVYIISLYLYQEPEPLTYEIFMWGDIGFINDVRFYGVAPHWYFRPYMAWLILCPAHRPGIFGLLFFFYCLLYQSNICGNLTYIKYKKNELFQINNKKSAIIITTFFKNIEYNLFYKFFFYFFFIMFLYATSFLPYGRFYNRLGGNNIMLFAFIFIFFFVGFKNIKNNILLLHIYIQLLKKIKYINFKKN